LIPVEKRDIFLQRIAAMLALRGRGRFTVTDVADVAQLALWRRGRDSNSR
jgi:Mg-chelatase subunit ChlI